MTLFVKTKHFTPFRSMTGRWGNRPSGQILHTIHLWVLNFQSPLRWR